MRAVVQRVTRAEVRVDGVVVGAIGAGLAILLGVGTGDGDGRGRPPGGAPRAAARSSPTPTAASTGACSTRAARRSSSASSRSTATASRGNRPSFTGAAAPELAEPLYERVCERLRPRACGAWSAGASAPHMQVELVNDGPVTIVVEL